MRRTVTPELLDTDAGSPAEIAASLADLRRINRWFGGASTTRTLLSAVARGRSRFSLLDVGAGSGDIGRAVQEQMARRGMRLEVTLLDRNLSHLRDGGAEAPRPSRVVGCALALPFRDDSFDAVSSALLLHHLEPEEAVRFLREALRVCRVAVLVNDLRRSWPHLAAVYSGFVLYRSRMTRHDSVASVRRSYTLEELRAIASRAGAARVIAFEHYFFRMGVILFKKAGGTGNAS